MSEQNTAWFHCGRCGSLFSAFAGGSLDRQCGKCGDDPHIGTAAAAPGTRGEPSDALPATGSTARSEKRASKKRPKANFLPLKLIGIWLVLLGLIVWLFQRSSVETSRPAQASTQSAEGRMSEEDAEFVNIGALESHAALVGFLSASTHEGRSQFIFRPASTVWKMTRFYGQNPLPSFDPAGLVHLRSAIIDLPDGRGLISQWRTAESRQIETFVRQEQGEWLLDWEHFARYSDFPWPLFLAGGGEDEGEFRLLVRERLAGNRGPADPLSVVFHAPRFGEPGQIDRPSPEFILNPGSANAGLLDEAFAKVRNATAVPAAIATDPPGMIRVRVLVRRAEEGDARRFELVEVRATDWRTGSGIEK